MKTRNIKGQFIKGMTTWNKGKSGYLSLGALENMSKANKGKHRGKEFKKGDMPPKHKFNCICFRCGGKGYIPLKGSHLSEDHKLKVSLVNSG